MADITGRQIKDYSIQRKDIDISTVGQSLITKLILGTGLSMSYTGADSGTGDVTLSATGVTSINGTANQVNVNGNTGAVIISLPQNIHSGAAPTFAGMTLTGGLVFPDGRSQIEAFVDDGWFGGDGMFGGGTADVPSAGRTLMMMGA